MTKEAGIVLGICFGVVGFALCLCCFFGWLRHSQETVAGEVVLAHLNHLDQEDQQQQQQQR